MEHDLPETRPRLALVTASAPFPSRNVLYWHPGRWRPSVPPKSPRRRSPSRPDEHAVASAASSRSTQLRESGYRPPASGSVVRCGSQRGGRHAGPTHARDAYRIWRAGGRSVVFSLPPSSPNEGFVLAHDGPPPPFPSMPCRLPSPVLVEPGGPGNTSCCERATGGCRTLGRHRSLHVHHPDSG